MKTGFVPTQVDVDRYLRLRAARDQLGLDMVRYIPEQAHVEIGEALGILRNGVVVFERSHVSAIMADCCLYDWYDEDGFNVVQRYAQTHHSQPGTDEHYLLNAFLHAKYRLLHLGTVVPGAGVHCKDMIDQEELFVMDIAMSRGPSAPVVLATRTIPLGEYWMTCGTGLPITSPDIMKNAERQYKKRAGPDGGIYLEDLSLAIVRACLDAATDKQVDYEKVRTNPREPRHMTRRNRRDRHGWRR